MFSRIRKVKFKRAHLLSFIALVLLLNLILSSSKEILFAIYDQHTADLLDHWQKKALRKKNSNVIVKESEANQAIKSVNLAISFRPENPEAMIRKIKLLQYLQFDAGKDDFAMRTEELDLYRKAILLRPAWPYSWAEFAMVKARIPELDGEFESALERAMTLGPWEYDVQIMVARLGFHFRGWLSPEIENKLEHNLKRLSQRYPGRALSLAKEYGQKAESDVCKIINNPKKYPVCRKIGNLHFDK